MLKQLPDQRAVILGQYIIETKSTVRAAAKKFGISKSTVHTVVKKRMEFFNINYKKATVLSLCKGGCFLCIVNNLHIEMLKQRPCIISVYVF